MIVMNIYLACCLNPPTMSYIRPACCSKPVFSAVVYFFDDVFTDRFGLSGPVSMGRIHAAHSPGCVSVQHMHEK